jgi:lactoylglutathione lyase
MPFESCIPVIPSADLERSLRLWVDGLRFSMNSEMRKAYKLIFCMLRKDNLWFMLNQRTGSPVKPKSYKGIRF